MSIRESQWKFPRNIILPTHAMISDVDIRTCQTLVAATLSHLVRISDISMAKCKDAYKSLSDGDERMYLVKLHDAMAATHVAAIELRRNLRQTIANAPKSDSDSSGTDDFDVD